MSTEIAKKEPSAISTVRAALESMKPQFAACLPKHLTADRLMRVAMTAIQTTPKLLDCDRTSLYAAIMKSAQLGLEPDGILGQAYLIPYGKNVQFIAGYKGLIDLARRSGEVSNIVAKEVYSNDEFKVHFHEDIPFTHIPLLSGDRGEITHFWALARFKDGGFHWDYMSKAEVDAIRAKSPGANHGPWKDHYVEMGKKTAIRRIAKYLPMSVQKAAIVDSASDEGKNVTIDTYGDITIEDTTVDKSEEVKTEKKKPTKLENFASEPGHNPETGEVKDPMELPENPTGAQAELYAKQLLQELEAQPDELKQHLFNIKDGERLLEVLRNKELGILAAKVRKSIPEMKGVA
jgi:recombination protein RecT